MKQIFLTLGLILFTLISNSQTVGNFNINNDSIHFINVKIVKKGNWNPTYRARVDYGQQEKNTTKDNHFNYIFKNNQPKDFHSKVEILNYFYNNNWNLTTIYDNDYCELSGTTYLFSKNK